MCADDTELLRTAAAAAMSNAAADRCRASDGRTVNFLNVWTRFVMQQDSSNTNQLPIYQIIRALFHLMLNFNTQRFFLELS